MANPRYTYCPQVNSYIDPEHSSLLVDSAVDSNLQAIYLAGSMLVGGLVMVIAGLQKLYSSMLRLRRHFAKYHISNLNCAQSVFFEP